MNEELWGFSGPTGAAAKFLYEMVMVITVMSGNPSDPVTLKTLQLGFRTKATCETTGAALKAKIDQHAPAGSSRGAIAEFVCYPTNK